MSCSSCEARRGLQPSSCCCWDTLTCWPRWFYVLWPSCLVTSSPRAATTPRCWSSCSWSWWTSPRSRPRATSSCSASRSKSRTTAGLSRLSSHLASSTMAILLKLCCEVPFWFQWDWCSASCRWSIKPCSTHSRAPWCSVTTETHSASSAWTWCTWEWSPVSSRSWWAGWSSWGAWDPCSGRRAARWSPIPSTTWSARRAPHCWCSWTSPSVGSGCCTSIPGRSDYRRGCSLSSMTMLCLGAVLVCFSWYDWCFQVWFWLFRSWYPVPCCTDWGSHCTCSSTSASGDSYSPCPSCSNCPCSGSFSDPTNFCSYHSSSSSL